MPQTIKLSNEEAHRKGLELHELITLDMRDRKPQILKRRFVRETYFGYRERQLEYGGQSDIHLHLTTEKVENIVPKISNAFWNADPIINATQVGEEYDPEKTEDVQVFLNWAIDSDIDNFYDTFQSWSRNMLVDSVSVLKTYWNREIRNTVVVERAKIAWMVGELDLTNQQVTEPRLKLPAEILIATVPGLRDFRPEKDDTDGLDEELLPGLAYRVDFVDKAVL